MMKLKTGLSGMVPVAAGLALACNVAVAHHSGAMYDASKTMSVQGTLKRTMFGNPHSWIWMVVPSSTGTPDLYSFEGGSIAELLRHWGPNAQQAFVVGKQVTITYHPLKDGRPSGQIVSITLPDGTVLKDAPGTG